MDSLWNWFINFFSESLGDSGRAGPSNAQDASAPTVVVVGFSGLDFLGTVSSFPSPDDKIRTASLSVIGGGNAANTAVAISRLGRAPNKNKERVHVRLVSKIGKDGNGQTIKRDLEDELLIDLQHVIETDSSPSTFVYVIVDTKTQTRTCIATPCEELTLREAENILRARGLFDGGNVKICHFDSRHTEASIIIAKEAIERGIITSIDVEKDRPPHLQSLLPLIDLVITNEKFCDTFFPAIDDDSNNHYPSLTVAIREEGADFGDTTFLDDKLLLKVRKMTKFFEGTTRAKVVISTLGSKGCVLISPMEVFSGQSLCFCPSLPDPDTTALSTLLQDKNKGGVVSTKECILKDTASGRSFHVIECDAFPLHPQDIQDTTGAGDAFIGGLLYAQACQYDFYDSLRLATIVASESLKAKGARASPTYDAVVKILSA